MKTNSFYKIALLLLSSALILSGTALAGKTTIEGKINGANCVIDKKVCPMTPEDPHLALEVDFVLSDAGGKYYFLPNLSRSQKSDLVNKDVRITGDLQGISLVASVIEEKTSGNYQEVWNWEKIARSLSRGN